VNTPPVVRLRQIAWISVILLIMVMQSCGVYGIRHGDSDWHRIPRPDYEIPPYAKWVAGMCFCLDPGHGGDAHIKGYKRGPRGFREAVMNLRVALYLKDFLERAGAEVILTRTDDSFVSLADRAQIANRNAVDMFISLHHNASSNPASNYASTWYHADADFSPVSLDLARYIQQNLLEYLRLPQQLAAGLLSDYLMYPEGFGVLRHLERPGILIEASFFSDPKEEKLLMRKKYNKLEAWSHFLAICQWAAAGIPRAELLHPKPASSTPDKKPLIELQLHDGLHERPGSWMLPRQQLLTQSIQLFLNEEQVSCFWQPDSSRLYFEPEDALHNGWHSVRADVINYAGNHTIPRPQRFRVAAPAQRLIGRLSTTHCPADGRALVAIRATALDSDHFPVADGDSIEIQSDYGTVLYPKAYTCDGSVTFYLQAENRPDTASVQLTAGHAEATIPVIFQPSQTGLLQGFCTTDSNASPLPDVDIMLYPGPLSCQSDPDGFYVLPELIPGHYQIGFFRNGYFPVFLQREIQAARATLDTLRLRKVFNGALHDRVFVLDPRFGGDQSGTPLTEGNNTAQLNFLLARRLADLLTKAGADVYLLHDGRTTLSPDQRVDLSNQLRDGGYYIRLATDFAPDSTTTFEGLYYPGNETGKQLLQSIHARLQQAGFAGKARIQSSREPEIRRTNRAAIAVEFDVLQTVDSLAIFSDPALIEDLAYTVFDAFVAEYDRSPADRHELELQMKWNGQPLKKARIHLQGVFRRYTDGQGRCRFTNLTPGTYCFGIEHPDAGYRVYSVQLQNSARISLDVAHP